MSDSRETVSELIGVSARAMLDRDAIAAYLAGMWTAFEVIQADMDALAAGAAETPPPDWQRRGFLRAEKPTNDEHSFGL